MVSLATKHSSKPLAKITAAGEARWLTKRKRRQHVDSEKARGY